MPERLGLEAYWQGSEIVASSYSGTVVEADGPGPQTDRPTDRPRQRRRPRLTATGFLFEGTILGSGVKGKPNETPPETPSLTHTLVVFRSEDRRILQNTDTRLRLYKIDTQPLPDRPG